ncbi:helix-turn-helix domain-containing protein [Caulobacter segnis]|uniref:helix-turn-helix domain-containing protein n=1 Tax=Caulobacter segnis TaxID=88688 RepID=UPI001CBF34F1|nr:helix-turn-helix domain-containing protein [Caulobacter segnis]UAL09142.1 helix-turn-helix domain-containing protein [Caulobacter segnis]
MNLAFTTLPHPIAPPPTMLGQTLVPVGVTIRRAPGEEIFAQGEPVDTVYQVMSGTVRTYRLLGDGRRHVCDFHTPGDLLGLETTDEYCCSAEGMTDVILHAIPLKALRRLTTEDPLLGQRLLAIATGGMQRSQNHASMLARLGAVERVAAFLVDFARRFDADDELDLPMTRQDIADYLGLTIHTVSRTLSQLQDQGLIDARASRRVRLRRQDELLGLCA